MQCPKCQSDNPMDAKYCNECGGKLEIVCVRCNKSNPPGSKFCNACGHNLIGLRGPAALDYAKPQTYTPKFLANKILTTRSSIEGERKLVTVLFADVANYTSIAEKLDPEEVHHMMDGCFKVLMDEAHKYEGTINQFTGDGVMALFGAPVAHEDHAQRACHAALSIQKAIEEYSVKVQRDYGADFKMRIGLNSGPVIVGSIGDDLRMDYTAVGDTTNLASRIENMARPGTSLVSGHTYRLSKDFFQFKNLGKVEVKGKEELQELFELIKTGEVDTRIAASVVKGLTRFVGRKSSMGALLDAYNKSRSGSGQVVGIVGDAGVGKSRLLFELKNLLPPGEFTYLEGQCLHFGNAMAYLPVLDILRFYFEIKEGDQESQIKKNMKEKILQLDEKLNGVLPTFHELLSLEIEDAAYQKLEPQQKREKTFEALRDLFVCESQNRPIIIVVEDLHWIDKTSEEFLDYLIGSLTGNRILLILLYRPEFTHSWGSKSYYSQIGLNQLTSQSSAELIRAILYDCEIEPGLESLILGRSAGTPLYIEELTHSLLDDGSIQREQNQCFLAIEPNNIKIPDTIQGIIAARMDRLEENTKRTMQVASVIGRDFAYRILETITEMREELKSYLLNLQGLEFIYEKSLFPELEYIFKHALTQEVAYNSLLQKRRKEIHEKVGCAIEALYPERLAEYYELLAYHYGRSENKDKAYEYLDLANQKAAKLNAMEDAEAYFGEAMGLLDTLPETEENRQRRISLLVKQAEVFMLLFKFQEYYDLLTHYEPIARKLGNSKLLGAFYARLGHGEFSFGQFDKAIQRMTRAAELYEAGGSVEDAGYAYAMLEFSYLYRGDYDRVFAVKEGFLRMMEQRFNLRWYLTVHVVASRACICLGRWNEAVEEAEKALKVAEESSDHSLIALAVWTLSMAYNWKGDLDRAVEYGELALHKAPTPADKAWAQRGLGWAFCRTGNTERGIELLTTALKTFRGGRWMPGVIPTMCTLGGGYWMAGKDDKATQTLEEALEIADHCGARYYAGFAQRLLGETALKTNPAQAAIHFEQSITVLQEIKAENELALTYVSYGRFHKQQSQIALAREYLTKALKIFERLGTLIEPEKVREELDELPDY